MAEDQRAKSIESAKVERSHMAEGGFTPWARELPPYRPGWREQADTSWRPEEHLPSNPDARPPEGDVAGWCRFYAWSYYPRPWGQGEGNYGGSCQDVHFAKAADEIDRLRAALAPFAEVADWMDRNGHKADDLDTLIRGADGGFLGHFQIQPRDCVDARAALTP